MRDKVPAVEAYSEVTEKMVSEFVSEVLKLAETELANAKPETVAHFKMRLLMQCKNQLNAHLGNAVKEAGML